MGYRLERQLLGSLRVRTVAVQAPAVEMVERAQRVGRQVVAVS